MKDYQNYLKIAVCNGVAIILVFVTIFLVSNCTSCSNGTNDSTDNEIQTVPLTDEKLQKIREKFDDRITHSEFKGAVYAVYNDEVVYEKGIGKANKKDNIDNDINTVFRIGSCTKQFTAAAIMMLQEQGKLSVDDTIDKYFPDYEYGKSITIHHLLCMRSGIVDVAGDRGNNGVIYSNDTIPFDISPDNTPKENRKILEDWFMSQPLKFTPDEKYEYSGSGYMLLGEIIEQVSGMTYEDFIQKNIFEPLDMTSSGFVETYDMSSKNVAQPYAKETWLEWFDYPGVCYANADIMSSASDLHKWIKGFINGNVVNRGSFYKMTKDYCNVNDGCYYGYGLIISPDAPIIFHEGHVPSFYSSISFSPEYGYVQILLNNYSYPNTGALSADISNDFYSILLDE